MYYYEINDKVLCDNYGDCSSRRRLKIVVGEQRNRRSFIAYSAYIQRTICILCTCLSSCKFHV